MHSKSEITDNMKVIYQVLLLAAVVALAYQIDQPTCAKGAQVIKGWAALTEPHVCECIQETGADPVLVDFWIHYGEFPNNHAMKCAIRCVYVALGISDEHNNLNITLLKSLVPLPPDVFDPILDKCVPLVGADECDRFYKLEVCLFTDIFEYLCPKKSKYD